MEIGRQAESIKRVLITGGLGFIGCEVAGVLASAGHKVVILDSLQSNVISSAEMKAIHPKADIFEQDIADYVVGDPSRISAFDVVVHAASVVGSVRVIEYLGTLADEIMHSTQLLANACLNYDVDLIAISSSEVYGRSGVLSESDTLAIDPNYNARTEYAIGKLATECMISNLRHAGLRALILRPFNVVGPRQNAITGFVLPTFVQQAMRGDPLTVFHDGLQERSFTSVADIAAFILNCICRTQRLPDSINGKILNIGTSRNRCTILELAKLVNFRVGNGAGYILVDPVRIHGDHYFESASVIKIANEEQARLSGWNPQHDLDKIVSDVVDHYRSTATTPLRRHDTA
jgi:UDP-glucose 4-epimerase